jgi:hypothetical protein
MAIASEGVVAIEATARPLVAGKPGRAVPASVVETKRRPQVQCRPGWRVPRKETAPVRGTLEPSSCRRRPRWVRGVSQPAQSRHGMGLQRPLLRRRRSWMVQSEIRLPPPGWAEGGVRILSSNADYTDGAHVTPPRHGAPTETAATAPSGRRPFFMESAAREGEKRDRSGWHWEGFDQPRRSSQTGTSKGCSHRSNRDRGCLFLSARCCVVGGRRRQPPRGLAAIAQ